MSHPQHHAVVMHADPRRLRTFRDFLDQGQGLQCWCPGCKRYAKVEASMWVTLGKGDREVKRCRPRCRRCGKVGIWSLTGPVSRC